LDSYLIIKEKLKLMNNSIKDKKTKKKSKKTIKSDENKLSDYDYSDINNEVSYTAFTSNPENFVESQKQEQSAMIDVTCCNIGILKGRKGHLNFTSKQAVSTGTYYFEVSIVSTDYNFLDYIYPKRVDDFSKKYYENILQNPLNYSPNVRIGFVQNSADFELPLGADEKSYSYRARDGSIIYDGMNKEGNQTYGQGDVIGVLIHLKPPMPEFLKNTSSKTNECYIKFYKNGEEQKENFINIKEGVYHAAVTLFNFSQVQVNFGPKFQYTVDESKNLKSYYEVFKI
jgi:hypothetical protein